VRHEAVSDTKRDAKAPGWSISPRGRALAKRLGLRLVSSSAFSIGRRRRGKGWVYLRKDSRVIRDRREIRRLSRLAVPPAYRNVLYAADPSAHLQAVGEDAAGRLQYRYHPDWEQVREDRKAVRLVRLAQVLPRIRRCVSGHLAAEDVSRATALSAVIELVACTAIRPGEESYLRERGTRGAATLLKSNVTVAGDTITLKFRAKGGKTIEKSVSNARLARAIERLRAVPGPRQFQYRAEDGSVRRVSARETNAFLQECAGTHISLKDFRTLMASASVLDRLARTTPEASERKRKKQVKEAIKIAAGDLYNTPAICRRSYVHGTVVSAFENGVLERFADALAAARSPVRRAQVLAEIVASNGA
jgi:DNA topoisomerase I